VRGRHRSQIRVAAAMLPLLLLWTPNPVAQATATGGLVTLTVLAPTSLEEVSGSHEGSVEALATRDQAGTADDPSRYVRLRGEDAGYVGYRTFTLPPEIAPASISTLTLAANFRGPIAATERWTWSIHDPTHGGWIRLGTQDHCGGDAGTQQWPCNDLDRTPWKSIRINVIRPTGVSLADLVVPATGEIRIRISSREAGCAKLDFEALEVYANDGSSDPVAAPPVGARWQWQLQGTPGRHASEAVTACDPTCSTSTSTSTRASPGGTDG
jgi:hypothetical protein